MENVASSAAAAPFAAAHAEIRQRRRVTRLILVATNNTSLAHIHFGFVGSMVRGLASGCIESSKGAAVYDVLACPRRAGTGDGGAGAVWGRGHREREQQWAIWLDVRRPGELWITTMQGECG